MLAGNPATNMEKEVPVSQLSAMSRRVTVSWVAHVLICDSLVILLREGTVVDHRRRPRLQHSKIS